MPTPSKPVTELARAMDPNQLTQLFSGAHFPCDRKQLVDYARGHFASADMLAVLDSLPERVYHNSDEILQGIRQLGQS